MVGPSMRVILNKSGLLALIGVATLIASLSFAQQVPPKGDATLKPEELQPQATKMMGEMKAMLQNAFNTLKEARAEKDVQKLNFVNEVLSAIKGLVKLAEGNFVELQEAVASQNLKKAEHQFVKISIAYDKVRELDGRIRTYRGTKGGAAVEGTTDVERVTDPDLLVDQSDPIADLNEIDIDLARPPQSSPFY